MATFNHKKNSIYPNDPTSVSVIFNRLVRTLYKLYCESLKAIYSQSSFTNLITLHEIELIVTMTSQDNCKSSILYTIQHNT